MGTYVPNTEEERQAMLEACGFRSFDEMYAVIPEALKRTEPLLIPEGMTEMEVRRALEELGAFVYPSEAAFLLADFGRDVRPLEEYLYGKKILVRRCMDFEGIDDGRHLRLAVKDVSSNARFIKELEETLQCAENH